MSNNQAKKRAAEKHNELRKKKLADDLDRKENPEKYKRYGSTAKELREARMVLAASAVFTAL